MRLIVLILALCVASRAAAQASLSDWFDGGEVANFGGTSAAMYSGNSIVSASAV